MDVYVDSSVVLRHVFAQADALASWTGIDRPVSSELVRVECLRTIDRARFSMRLADEVVAERRAAVLDSLATFSLIPLSAEVLERASDPFPTSLATLDAIHLATALAVRDRFDGLRIATHDVELGLAARAMGFEVDGLIS